MGTAGQALFRLIFIYYFILFLSKLLNKEYVLVAILQMRRPRLRETKLLVQITTLLASAGVEC